MWTQGNIMNVVYFGYRSWAYIVLANLVRHGNPRWSIKETFRDGDAVHLINKVDKPEVLLFYGWSWIIPKEVYDKYICLICHISPLPKYRGGSPLQHQIMNGEKTSAVTILRAREKLDTGEIYSQTPVSLNGTMDEIFERIAEIASKDTIKVLDQIATGKAKPKKQNDKKATYYKRRKPEESEIKLEDFDTAEQLYNFIRALTFPYPNAYIVCKDGKKLYLTEAHL